MARKRTKIHYCYHDYMKQCSQEARQDYQNRFGPLIDIIEQGEDDKTTIRLAREYDAAHGTEMFAEAVHLTVYCIACSKFDCDC